MQMARSEQLHGHADSLSIAELLRHEPGFVFLDSASSNSHSSRFDLIAFHPTETLLCTDHSVSASHAFLDAWNQAYSLTRSSQQSHCPFLGGWIAALSYDFGEALQGICRNEKNRVIAHAAYYPWGILIDKHGPQTLWIDDGRVLPAHINVIKSRVKKALSKPPLRLTEGREPEVAMGFEPRISRDEYAKAFARIQGYLLAGDCYQVNYAQPFVSVVPIDPWDLYTGLRAKNAGEFGCFWPETELGTFLSFSPELFLRTQGDRVLTSPIKGTAPRDEDPQRDQALALQLMQSQKNRAENIMIVDLLRNDLGRVCEVGSVVTTAICELKSLPSVHHLVSHVEGTLPPESTPIDLLRAAFPGGSITGAPKRRAMEIIAELEVHPRGMYCGSVVALGNHGTMVSSIAIRSMTLKGATATVWGGGGIVSDSQADEEYEECLTKLSKILS